jgi:type IV pilus assembly protein PilX
MVAINRTRGQQGFALFMTLVTLVIITISGIAMMRVMEAGTSAAGNIAFRQAAIRVADVAAENARSWLSSASSLATSTTGYYANMDTVFNPITFDWDNNSRDVGAPVSGYTVNYVIHRMAMNDGLCSEINTGCTYPAVASSSGVEDGGSHAGGSGPGSITSAVGKVYYRITVKVSGPKRNISFVQVFMY